MMRAAHNNGKNVSVWLGCFTTWHTRPPIPIPRQQYRSCTIRNSSTFDLACPSYSAHPAMGTARFTRPITTYLNHLSLMSSHGLSGVTGQCGTGWLQAGDYCYWLSTKLVSFQDAESVCAEKEASLVSLATPRDMEPILHSVSSPACSVLSGGLLHRSRCSDLAAPLCRRSAWTSCYKTFPQKVSYADAVSNCQQHSSTLLPAPFTDTVRSIVQQSVVCDTSDNDVWLRSSTVGSGPFQTPAGEGSAASGTSCIFVSVQYNLLAMTGNCLDERRFICTKPFGQTDAVWSNGYCFDSRPYVCEISASDDVTNVSLSGSCDNGWQLQGEQCYLLGANKNFTQARDFCRASGGSLAIVHTALEEAYLAGEPNDAGQGEDCVQMVGAADVRAGAWNDNNCSKSSDYICQKAATMTGSVTRSTSPTVPWSAECGPGWVYARQTSGCYLLVTDDVNTWRAARADCRRRGGDLISITSHREQTQLQAMASSSVVVLNADSWGGLWIGTSDNTKEGGWEWSDGSPFRYINWDAGQPDNRGWGGEEQDCGVAVPAHQMMWDDRDCVETHHYICEKPAAQVTQPTLVPLSSTSPRGE
ncbi:hypothetical protein BaRGS_00012148 [Batillaria attramentaria]|uniref:C-type lectin domain-containing protein n=1 Tax=Batillaria attramentaria TaxID=370345 RepID=A0ABD0LA93_9CAEN